jgi:hypothetical protein
MRHGFKQRSCDILVEFNQRYQDIASQMRYLKLTEITQMIFKITPAPACRQVPGIAK